jgi:hypothetical protein
MRALIYLARRRAILDRAALRWSRWAITPATKENRARFDRADKRLRRAAEQYAFALAEAKLKPLEAP